MDVARSAKRLGASEAIVVYRRTREKMPAHDFEVREAEEEGVMFKWLSTIKAEAEGKTVQDKVALVLTDLEMPVMDGFTLTRNIKQDGRFKGIPVIIHSSLTGTANEGHVKSVGADAYIAKFVAEELGATIRQVLAR